MRGSGQLRATFDSSLNVKKKKKTEFRLVFFGVNLISYQYLEMLFVYTLADNVLGFFGVAV